jgi:transcriptional regulator with XRE-family HTH domain
MSKIDNLIQSAIQQLHFKRKQKGLNQKELADLVGCSDKSISNFESLKTTPSLELLKKLCKVLEIDL